MDYVRLEVEEHSLVEEAIDPDGIEVLGHVEKNCAGKSLVEIFSFNETGQLQGPGMSGYEPKMLVSHPYVFVSYI
jgi:hypothetical protein